MGKRVIRLTEADIEKIVKKVIKEQGSGDLKPKKRKYKDKTDRNSPNWDGGDSGTLNFDLQYQEITPLAYNVTEYYFDVRQSKDLARKYKTPKSSETPPQQTPPKVIIPKFSVEGSSLPYADNMVMPYFDKYEGSKEKFKSILDAFVRYIKAGGGDKLDNVTIKGSADSGTPTLVPPSGYSKLDHPGGTPYGGKTDPKEMNQYLADMRAEQYANVLINEIKKETGFDLKITVLQGDNYYGQDGKRGIEYRKITVTPNAPELKPVSTTTTSGAKTDGSKTTTELVKGGAIPLDVAVFIDGQESYVEGYKVNDFYNDERLCVTREESEFLGLPLNFRGNLNSYVKGQDFYVNGKKVGPIDNISYVLREKLKPASYNSPDFKGERIGEPSYFAGPITVVDKYANHKVGDKEVTMAYLIEVYFTFFQ